MHTYKTMPVCELTSDLSESGTASRLEETPTGAQTTEAHEACSTVLALLLCCL
jgi:hypothetical protein